MSDATHNNTTTTTTTRDRGGNSALAFIVGILVVVVALLGYVVFSGGVPTASGDDGADLNITVQSEDGAAPAADPKGGGDN
ncbi:MULTISPECIES: hypothetical protein [unclassified Mameliella]|uniref:hypothetical protein n=1 Tax=unclassified Mameliella TaxID=2630630 RepID=UPI00273E8F1C|nr:MULTISPECIES: hypothetical protein [unclassified Mameliella]